MDKKELFHYIIGELKAKQLFLERELKALSESLENSAKSSAGDKHETDTSMNQLEQEQLTRQLLALQSQQQIVHQLNSEIKHTRITTGSLLKTSKALFFISVGIGKIKFQENEILCINLQSPAGQQFHLKSIGDVVRIGNEDHEILEIS